MKIYDTSKHPSFKSPLFVPLQVLEDLKKGIKHPSKKPKFLRKRQWGEADIQLVLKTRRENPTYGKSKIETILQWVAPDN